MIPSAIPVPQIAACVLLLVIVVAWSIHLARRKGRWLLTVGPLAAAALFGAATQWPRPESAAASAEPKSTTSSPLVAEPSGVVPADNPAPVRANPPPAAAPTPLGPPPRVVLRGRWSAEDSLVVATALARALSRVPAAGGGVLELDGSGRAVPPNSHGMQQYAIAATWTLRPAPDAEVLAGSGLGELLGVGASPDQARRGAADHAARSIAAILHASLPAPRSVSGASPSPY